MTIEVDDDPAVILVAHGSRDPRAAVATRALAAAVRAARPRWDVRASFLDHSLPRPVQVLGALEAAGRRRAVLVPLLLTAAYHGRVDVPAEVAAARAAGVGMDVAIADVLGPHDGRVDPLLLAALTRRLAEAAGRPDGAAPGASGPGASGPGAPGPGVPGPVLTGRAPAAAGVAYDAVVLAAAGTRDSAARATVGRAAARLGAHLGVPCTVAYASAAPPDAGAAVSRLRAAGAVRVGLAAYFLAPGLLYDAAVDSARAAGAVAAAAPMTDAPELAALVQQKVMAVTARWAATCAA